jgi:cytoskeletal protein CcmA (bactofilin family)
MNAGLLLTVFVLMCCLPLLPGLIEVLRPRDRYPLPVNLDYVKDPRYLGNSLRVILARAMARNDAPPGAMGDRAHQGEDPSMQDLGATGAPERLLGEGVHQLELSRPESVRITGHHEIGAGERCHDVLAVRGDLIAADGAVLEREVHVRGSVRLADTVSLRALACDGEAHLGRGVSVLRWIDAHGDIVADEGCRLGQHCACGARLRLQDDCRFARLFGAEVTTPNGRSRTVPLARGPRFRERPEGSGDTRNIDDVLRCERGDLTIDAGGTLQSDLLVYGDLTVQDGVTIDGTLRVSGSVHVNEGVVVHGSIIADGPVTLGAGTTVAGNVFSQQTVLVEPGVQVGRKGAVKSLIGNRGVVLRQEVVVHGYVLTEGEGVVRCTDC